MKKLLSTICSVFIVWGVLIIHYENIESVQPGSISIIGVDEKNFMFTPYGVLIFEGYPEIKDVDSFKFFIPHRLIWKISRKDEVKVSGPHFPDNSRRLKRSIPTKAIPRKY